MLPPPRAVAWLARLALVAAWLFAAGSAAALSGAVHTSNRDGTSLDDDFAAKSDAYLTGGPCQGGSHLAAGDYYFEVSSPAGDLLSTDPIGNRRFTVGANGFISATSGTHSTHPVGCPGVSGVTLQLVPYADTPDPAGGYTLTVATAGSVEQCEAFEPESITFEICSGADSESADFTVEESVAATPSPSPSPTPSPELSPSPSPAVSPASPAPVTPSPAPSPTQRPPPATPTATPPRAGRTAPSTSTGDPTQPGASGRLGLVLIVILATTAGVLILRGIPGRGGG